MTLLTEVSLEQRLVQLRGYTEGLEGEALLRKIMTHALTGRLAAVSSFGAESAVLLDILAQVDRAAPVIFLDTGKLFAETLAYRDALIARLGLSNVCTVQPCGEDLQRSDPNGDLWRSDPDSCCFLRKSEPLDAALAPFDAWITGRKRFQAKSRAALSTIEGDPVTGKIKINPLATWGAEDIERYLTERDLPRHPLVAAHYLSIGCRPCTRPVGPGEDQRAGRWSWLEKKECGIHRSGL
ncbi:Adenosine 5'-phosphosulfate reductase [Azospirillaceae bacterium]